MYTIQALWTMAARPAVTVVVFANQAYNILLGEYYAGVGAGTPGPRAAHMLRPWTRRRWTSLGLARSMGVEATRVDDPGGPGRAAAPRFHRRGPCLIEAVL